MVKINRDKLKENRDKKLNKVDLPSPDEKQEQPVEQTQPDLGILDLSDTVSEMENSSETVLGIASGNVPGEVFEKLGATPKEPETLDLSQTQALDVIIQEPIIIHKKSKWVIPSIILATVGIITAVFMYLNAPTQVQNNIGDVVNTTPVKDLDSVKTFTAELKRTADQTGTPYKISTETIGGEYVLGITTYNPDNPKELYMDYMLLKPEHPEAQVEDDKAKAIKEKLKSELPTINKSIKVKVKEKVSMEVYKLKDHYQTVLLYEGKPFGYVSTDKDDVSTNYVTSYYVTDVAAE